MNHAVDFNVETIRPFVLDQGDRHRLDLFVRGVKCGHCVNKISQEMDSQSDILDYQFESGGQRLSLWGSPQVQFNEVVEKINSLGFEAVPVTEGLYDDREQQEFKRELKKLAVAAVCAGNIMLFSAAIYLGAPAEFTAFFHKLSFVLIIPVYLFSASSIWYGFTQAVRHQRFNLDFPIGLALLLGGALSVYSFFTGGEAIYFDSLAVVVFLILSSRFILNRFVNSIYQKNIIHFVPGVYQARVWQNGNERLIPIDQITSDLTLKVYRSETIPADGLLVSQQAIVDASVLTGESVPQVLNKGERVYAGTRLAVGECLIQVTQSGRDSRVGRYVSQALENHKKAQEESFLWVSYFTLMVVVASLLTFLGVYLTTGLAEAFERSFAIILVACPCAVSFGIPLIGSFSGQLAIKNGLILKNPRVLKKLRNITEIFLDKTGTLTESQVKVSKRDFEKLAPREQEALLALELSMDHPISNGFREFCKDGQVLPQVRDFVYRPGVGLSGQIDGHFYEVVSQPGENKTLLIKKDQVELAEIGVSSGLKKDLKVFFKEMADRKLKVSVLSGDTRQQVEAIKDLVPEAARGDFLFEATPEQKSQKVAQSHGEVMMVGDGVNDLGAMNQAALSVCMPGALENNIDLADINLTQGDLGLISKLFNISKKVSGTEKRLLIFTSTYNSICIVLAMMGLITPVAAAILMPISSLSVLSLVSFRLRAL